MPNTSSPTRNLRDISAGRDDRARHIQPWHRVLRSTKPEAQHPHQVGLARHEMPGAPVHPGRPHLHEHLIRGHGGLRDLLQPEHVLRCGAVPVLHDRPHRHLLGAGAAALPGRLSCVVLIALSSSILTL